MKLHETVIILRTDITEDEREKTIQTIIEKINEKGKLKGDIDRKGIKKFAYKIKECSEGYYIVFQFEMQTSLIKEVEILIRNNQNILKYMIVKVVED